MAAAESVDMDLWNLLVGHENKERTLVKHAPVGESLRCWIKYEPPSLCCRSLGPFSSARVLFEAGLCLRRASRSAGASSKLPSDHFLSCRPDLSLPRPAVKLKSSPRLARGRRHRRRFIRRRKPADQPLRNRSATVPQERFQVFSS